MPVGRNKTVFGAIILLLVFNILSWRVLYDFYQHEFLEVNFFDVGQGDAIFIETPQQHQILIDGGPGAVILERLSRVMPFWDRTIDLVILTHPESDHLRGLLEVLKNYKVENVLWTGIVRDTAEYGEWQDLIEKEGANIFIAKAGEKIISGSTTLKILHPLDALEGKEIKDSNDTSVVVRLVFGGNSFLFLGDVYKANEREMAEGEINYDVLKIAHNGSKTSTDPEFIKRVRPKVAVISVGKDNKYGHPHQETLDTLGKYGIDILRTDINGNIKIISNGNNYGISTVQN
ncbi:MAG: ComEC/Rec2 family competence protein [Candidatus Pacebacteria bacterium]|nr:ComEC/Rec2 family competence protein [Candidatus Paceibacterota bacterium]